MRPKHLSLTICSFAKLEGVWWLPTSVFFDPWVVISLTEAVGVLVTCIQVN